MRRLPSSWNRTMAKLGFVRISRPSRPTNTTAKRLRCEVLETRRVLATLTVSTNADNVFEDGHLTLREAIVVANQGGNKDLDLFNFGTSYRQLTAGERGRIAGPLGDDIIKFSSLSGAINISQGALNVTGEVSIDGDGDVVIDGSGNNGAGIFIVSSYEGAEIKFLTLQNGTNELNSGGAIFATTPALRLEGVTFEGNSAPSGGAVSLGYGNHEITGCTFIENSAIGVLDDISFGHGGAVYVGIEFDSTVEIENSRFVENDASRHGGAIAIYSGADLYETENDGTLADSIVVRNSVFDLNESGESGGAIYLTSEGTAGTSEEKTVLFERLAISNNTAGVSGGGIYLGSEFKVTDASLDVVIRDSSIATNFALGGDRFDDGILAGGTYAEENGGGGIALIRTFDLPSASYQLINSTISGNKAENGGGLLLAGRMDVSHSTIVFNEAGYDRESQDYEDPCDADEIIDGLQYETVAGGGVALVYANSSNLSTFSHTIVARNRDDVAAERADRADPSSPNIAIYYDLTSKYFGYIGNGSGTAPAGGWAEDLYIYPGQEIGGCPNPVYLGELNLKGSPPSDWPYDGDAWEFLQEDFYLTLQFDYSIIDDRSGPLMWAGLPFDRRLGRLMQFADSTFIEVPEYFGPANSDPLLLPLQSDGGPEIIDGYVLQTHPLTPTAANQAIDSGDPALESGENGTPEFDQRGNGYERIFDSPLVQNNGTGPRIDIGAVELQPLYTPIRNADFNDDDRVDGLDLLIWQQHFGQSPASLADGDANDDDIVDIDDLIIWKEQFGTVGGIVLNANFNGDEFLDANDLYIWGENYGKLTGGTASTGDADGDGDVDGEDLLAWQVAFSDVTGSLDWLASSDVFANYIDGKIVVSSLDGGSDGDYSLGELTLREAIYIASKNSTADEIVFAEGLSGSIVLDSQLTVGGEVTITGPGADVATIDANQSGRVFSINSGADVTISGLTITGGSVTGANQGGAIHNAGDLTLSSVVVTDNHSAVYGGAIYSAGGNAKLRIEDSTVALNIASNTGGAIYMNSALTDALVIERSTFYGNDANTAGAIYLSGSDGLTGTATISNSTFSGNRALTSSGGAIKNAASAPPLTIINSTIAYNTSVSGGGGIDMHNNSDNRFTLHNTILAHNDATSATTDNLNRSVKSGSSYNVIGYSSVSSGLSGVPSNILLGSGVSAGLAPLGYYGGKTKTHALLVGSPALNVGNDSLAPAIDQRGQGRPDTSPSSSDIGAYEAGLGTTLTVRSDGDRNDSIALEATVASLRLREALALSAALAGRETIVFDQTGWTDGEIALSLGQLSTTQDVLIEGPGADLLTVNAQLASRVFNIGAAAEFRGLTIKGGSTTGSGGGIYSNGYTVKVDACAFESNYAATGGGLYFQDGELELSNSTFYDNHASGNGAGIYLKDADKADITNTTISGNIAVGNGGGIYNTNSGSPKIINSTIAYNQAATGGGIYNATSGVLVSNTIVAENTASTSSDMHGTFSNSSKNNLVGVDSVSLVGIDNGEDDNIVGGDAWLTPLDYYGGRTKVHLLYYNSDAIDHGNNGVAETYILDEDQRGFERVVDVDWDLDSTATIDIGAVEMAFDEYYS